MPAKPAYDPSPSGHAHDPTSLRPAEHTCECDEVDTGTGWGADGCSVPGPRAAIRRVRRIYGNDEIPVIVAFLRGDTPEKEQLAYVRGVRPPLRRVLRAGPPIRVDAVRVDAKTASSTTTSPASMPARSAIAHHEVAPHLDPLADIVRNQ